MVIIQQQHRKKVTYIQLIYIWVVKSQQDFWLMVLFYMLHNSTVLHCMEVNFLEFVITNCLNLKHIKKFIDHIF